MRILGIETSCDETAAAVIEANAGNKTVKLLSNVVASSLSLHAKTGGIIPEIAAREQLKYIIPVIQQAFKKSNLYPLSSKINLPSSTIYRPAIDAIAVTVGPGLIGSLLVGIETAKTLAYAWNKPIIPVNHLIGHIYANWLTTNDQRPTTILFPALALIVSGGHTDLVLMKNHQQPTWIGGTRDDAAGEAFDKIGRLLNLSYPGGLAIAAAATKFEIKNAKFEMKLPRPMLGEDNFDFSFSGLKTAAFREVNKFKAKKQFNNAITAAAGSRNGGTIQQFAFEVQQAIVDVLVTKTVKAAQAYRVKSVLISGGVAANDLLREKLEVSSQQLGVNFFAPAKKLCTDNAAMIAAAAFFNHKPISWKSVAANPSLHFQ